MKGDQGFLTAKEQRQLKELGDSLLLDLGCIANNEFPCRTCRLDAVELMKKYIRIHGYTVKLVK